MKVLLMSLLKNSSYILTLLSLFGFLLTWQRSAFSLFFLISIFLTLFWEFFLFLKLRKNIIKEATLIKGSLFYRVSMGDFYLYIFSFFLAIFGLVSLFLNFLNLEKIDFVFIFIILPLLMIFLKKELHLQFVDNAYNDFRIVVIASFFTALFYAFYGLFFTYNELLNLELFSRKIIAYKSASFVYFDFLSEFLHFVSNLKFFIFSYFGYLGFRALNFIFDFFNFFMFCSLLAFVFNFVLKIKIKIIVLFLCFIMVLGNYFLKEQRNNALKSEQEQILLWMNNIKYNEIYNRQRITSGVYMCATAVALGYKSIYISGIDFYQDTNNLYAFDNNKKNLLNKCTGFKNQKFKFINHSMACDLQALDYLMKRYDVNIYSLNSDEYFKLAPDIGSDFVLSKKPKKYINDILIPDKYAQERYYGKKSRLKENLHYKLIKDLIRLPSDIKHYLKEKYANKNR